MPDRQRHDEFIWALIFSLVVNLLLVFAFLGQRYVAKSPGLQPFVVSIAASPEELPHQSHANPGPTAILASARNNNMLTPPPALRVPSTSLDPPLTESGRSGATASSPATTPEGAAETTYPAQPTAGESVATTFTQKTAAGLSNWGDKMAGEDYTAPEYLGGEKPPYPKRAERNGWTGTVLLSLLINAQGEVEKVEIVKTSGYELLDQQARSSVGSWRFKPARRNGIAIAVAVQQPVIFRPPLQKSDP